MHRLKRNIFHTYVIILILSLQIESNHTVALPGNVYGSLLPTSGLWDENWHLDIPLKC